LSCREALKRPMLIIATLVSRSKKGRGERK